MSLPSGLSEESKRRLRALPPVDRLATAVARVVLEERRAELLAGAGRGEGSGGGECAGTAGDSSADDNSAGASSASDGDANADLLERARRRLRPSLRRVLNGTGVVIHTNLGRAPLPGAAVEAVDAAARGYCNLEMSMDSGRRARRDEHVRALLCELTGAEDALAVNNGAAAVLLAVAALAPEAVVVSRGQLVEIGGGFRITEIVAQTGARLVEVGTTNRTRVEDYRSALDAHASPHGQGGSGPHATRTGPVSILRVHQSNFRTVGFVEDVQVEQLCSLGVPVIDDIGSGALARDGGGRAAQEGSPAAWMLDDEPTAARSVAAGAALVCFSGDKLLGGPQAGLIVGRAGAVEACRRHPLARAIRIGRLPLAALEATLSLYRDPERALHEIPVLRMLSVDRDTLAARAQQLAEAVDGTVVDAVARVGGGALPLLELHGPAVTLEHADGAAGERFGGDAGALAAALRAGDPPLVPRIAGGRVLVDPRTLADEEIPLAAAVIASAADGRG